MKKILVLGFLAIAAGSAFAQDGQVVLKPKADEETALPAGLREDGKSTIKPTRNEIFSFSPIQFTENGVGFAFTYERGLDKDGVIAYELPLIVTFDIFSDAYTYVNKSDPMVHFAPGLKIYPTSNRGKVKYSIGPSLVAEVGENTQTIVAPVYYPYYGSPVPNEYVTQTSFKLGVMLNNTVNFFPAKKLYVGINLGFGFTYISCLNGVNQGMEGLVQGGFKIGFRR